VTIDATTTVFLKASIRSWLCASSRYHCVENPPQVDVLPVALNDKIIRTRIGA
jgi:hypothetical protein